MITGELKNKIDQIWQVFWEGGVTNGRRLAPFFCVAPAAEKWS
jgi:hypothetical protein